MALQVVSVSCVMLMTHVIRASAAEVGAAEAGSLLQIVVDAHADWEIKSAVKGEGLHEEMMMHALVQNKLAADSDYPNAGDPAAGDCPPKEISEYFRGVQFNDDPGGFLFFDQGDQGKHKKSTWTKAWAVWNLYNNDWVVCDQYERSVGAHWGIVFKSTTSCSTWTKWPMRFLCESHHGKLQFMHAMRSGGQTMRQTKDIMMSYAEFTYKVSIGDIKDTALVGDSMPSALASAFAQTNFPLDITVKNFFCMNDKGKPMSETFANAAKRAIGSLSHMLQDSYSTSHTERDSKNKWVINEIFDYHDNAAVHGSYDKRPGALGSLASPEAFEEAKVVTGKLIQYYKDRTKWIDVEKWLSTDIFKLHDGSR